MVLTNQSLVRESRGPADYAGLRGGSQGHTSGSSPEDDPKNESESEVVPEPEPEMGRSSEAKQVPDPALSPDRRVKVQESVTGVPTHGQGTNQSELPRMPAPSAKAMPPPRMQLLYPYYNGMDPYQQRGYPVIQGQPLSANGVPLRGPPVDHSYVDSANQRFNMPLPPQQPPAIPPRYQPQQPQQPRGHPSSAGMGMAHKGMQQLAVHPTPPPSAAHGPPPGPQGPPSSPGQPCPQVPQASQAPQGVPLSVPAGAPSDDHSTAHRPKLTVQIPGSEMGQEHAQAGAGDGLSQDKANGRSSSSIVSATAARWPTAFPQSPMQFFVAQQPSADPGSARDQGPMSRIGRTPSNGVLAGQTVGAETPTTALPSRYLSEMLASPSNMFSMEPDVLQFTPINDRKRVATGDNEPDSKRVA